MKPVYKQLATARSISEFGNAFRYIALPLGILSVRSRAEDLAIAEVLETMGFLLAGLIAPFFIDRFRKLPMLAVLDGLALIVSVGMIIAVAKASITLLWITSFFMTFVGTFHISSVSAATADLVDGENHSILTGFSNLQIYMLIGGLVGSTAATGVVTQISLTVLLGIDAITFLVASAWILRLARSIALAAPLEGSAREKSLMSYINNMSLEWRDGFSAAVSDRIILKMILSQGCLGFAYGSSTVGVISHYKLKLGFSDRIVGFAQINNRIWSLGGAYLQKAKWFSIRKIFFLTGAVFILGYFGMSVLSSWWFLVAYGFVNLAMAMVTPTNNALVMSGTPTILRGRVCAFRNLVIDVGVLLGNIFSLFMLAKFGTAVCFVLAAIGSAMALWIYCRVKMWPRV